MLILGRKKLRQHTKNAPKRVSSSTLLGAHPKTISLSSPNQPPLIAQPAGRHLPKAFHLHLAFLP